MIAGSEETLAVLASNLVYGFVVKLGDLQTKNKSGKAALNAKNAKPITPKILSAIEDNYICLLYTSPSPRDPKTSRMPSSA